MGVVKVTLNNNTLIDITDTTAVAADVAQTKYFYNVQGNRTVGTASGGGGQAETDLANLIAKQATASIDIPSGVTIISSYTFYHYPNLQSVTVPNTVTTINTYAFYECSNMTISSLPNSITSIASYAFSYCSALALTSLPSNLTSVGTYSFNNCTSLALSSLPSGLETIGSSAFYKCSSMTFTSLPPNLTTISSSAFQGCSNINITSFPVNLTSIGSSAFRECTGITGAVTLPNKVTAINNYAFYGCTNITSVVCEGQIATLGTNCFIGLANFNHPKLQEARFPNMTAIAVQATVFGSTTTNYACKQLALVDLGGATSISGNAFANCNALQTVILRKTSGVVTLGATSAFLNTPIRGYNNLTGTVYVPQALITTYQTASIWSDYYNAGTVSFVAIEGSPYEIT